MIRGMRWWMGALLLACTSSSPDPDAFGGLSAEVRIERDDFGMVHVEGETEADVLFASGYMQAHDRLLQMALVRLQSQGRRAEVNAEWADDDVLMRTLGTRQMGIDNAARSRELFAETHALMVAWTAGVNQRIAEVLEGRAPMPTGFAEMGFDPEPWTVGRHLRDRKADPDRERQSDRVRPAGDDHRVVRARVRPAGVVTDGRCVHAPRGRTSGGGQRARRRRGASHCS